jgi:DHA2 family multidrug resistance protein
MLIRDGAIAHARLADHVGANPSTLGGLPSIMNPSTGLGLQMLNGEVTRQGMMISYDNVFSWMALSVMLLAPLILILKPAPRIPMDREVHVD